MPAAFQSLKKVKNALGLTKFYITSKNIISHSGSLLRLYYLANDKNDMRARIWGCSSEQVLNIRRLSIIQISRMSQKAVIKVATQVIIIMTLQLSVLCV